MNKMAFDPLKELSLQMFSVPYITNKPDKIKSWLSMNKIMLFIHITALHKWEHHTY